MSETRKSCLYPSCGDKPTKRGLCTKHYFQAYRSIQRGRATWAALIAQKKAAPSQLDKPDEAWFVTESEKTPEATETPEAPKA